MTAGSKLGGRLPKLKTRCKPKALAPYFWLVTCHIASNQSRNGLCVSANSVPAVTETYR